jgi:hypothetical protein
MKYSISESARIAGYSRKTFYKHIEKKPISTEQDMNGNRVIDASELIRVYGSQCDFDRASVEEKAAPKEIEPEKQEQEAVPMLLSSTQAAVAHKELEMLRSQMEEERGRYDEQIEYLRDKLDEANAESRKLTALLTDQSSEQSKRGDEWQSAIAAMERRLANQERASVKNAERRKKSARRQQQVLSENEKLKKALKKEREKTFWQRLFG